MSIKGRDKEFRIPKVTYVDFKHIEMDRVLTMLFPRLKYDGYASRRPPRRAGICQSRSFWRTFWSTRSGSLALISILRSPVPGSRQI